MRYRQSDTVTGIRKFLPRLQHSFRSPLASGLANYERSEYYQYNSSHAIYKAK